MAATATAPPAPATDAPPYAIRPITVDEYHRMLEVGILYEKEPVELLDGQLIAMPPEGPVHGDVVSVLLEKLIVSFGDRARVRAGNPIELSAISEPEPDLAIVRRRGERYLKAHPKPTDVFFVVEVSISSLVYDRRNKLVAYARAGIPEYWIVDVAHGRVDVFTNPNETGYEAHRVVTRGGSITPQAFPESAFPVSSFLP